MPAPAANGGDERGRGEHRRVAGEHGVGEQDERERARSPAPVQMPAAHQSRREQAEEHAEDDVHGGPTNH